MQLFIVSNSIIPHHPYYAVQHKSMIAQKFLLLQRMPKNAQQTATNAKNCKNAQTKPEVRAYLSGICFQELCSVIQGNRQPWSLQVVGQHKTLFSFSSRETVAWRLQSVLVDVGDHTNILWGRCENKPRVARQLDIQEPDSCNQLTARKQRATRKQLALRALNFVVQIVWSVCPQVSLH
jgi:hypothetical protein